MPTCPKCGSPRVNRYCAKCGAEAVIESEERGYVPRTDYVDRGIPVPAAKPTKRSGPMTAVVFMCIPILVVIATFAVYFTAHSVTPTSKSGFPSDSQMDQLMRDFDLDAGSRITDAERSLTKLATTGNIELRLRQAKNDFANANATRVRLGSALRQARLEDRWPVRVDGVNFRTPQQLVDAMSYCDMYVRKAAAAEQELDRALDQNRDLQSQADRIINEMKRVRAEGDARRGSDESSLTFDQRQIHLLSDQLQKTLQNWTDVDWSRANLASFSLIAPQ